MMAESEARILLVDDEEAILKLLRFPLEKEGYQVVTARDGAEALATFAREDFDLVILDVMLPHVDGMEVCRRIRADSIVPIIMLTAKGDEFDKVLGLELGADDYITKDKFSLREFRSRVRAQLRRAEMNRSAEATRKDVIKVDDLEVDVLKRSVVVRGAKVDLTYIEFEILKTLKSPLIKFTVNTFPYQVIKGNLESISNLFSSFNGRHSFTALIFTDHLTGDSAFAREIRLRPILCLSEIGNYHACIKIHPVASMPFLNQAIWPIYAIFTSTIRGSEW